MGLGLAVPRWARPSSLRGAVAAALVLAALVTGVGGLYWLGKHYLAVYRLTRGVGDTVFLSADGRPWFRLDDHRRDVALSQISPHLRRAVVAVEDHRFRRHFGLDPVGLGRALFRNLRTGEVREGGSTLTQQLARTLFLSNERTLARKAKEAALALMLEQLLSKDQILELYLNRVYLSGGSYGVEAMCRQLFLKPARDVNLAEAALVAGLIRAPSALSPWSNLEGALRRSEVVLARMREEEYISAEQERQARTARLRITAHPLLREKRSGYAKDYLRTLFREKVTRDNPPEWQVQTSFVPAVQQAAEQAVGRGLDALGVRGLQAALVAIDPETGNVVALVGGGDWGAAPYNRAVRSRRQPGSAFKPFVYAAALEKGLSPVSVLHDLHTVVAGGRQEWSPRNAGGAGPDSQTLREALLESNNQAAVALQQKIGTGTVRRVASASGLSDLPDVPSLALGTGLVSPLELTAAYAVFPGGGLAVRPRALLRVLDADGELAFAEPVRRERVLGGQAAFQALSMLRDVVEVGTGSSARALGLRFPAAGKTGTTDDFKDAWFVGFSSRLVAGVWVGFDQPAPIGREAYGARVALPIWVDFMRRAARAFPPGEFDVPAGLHRLEMCRVSYLRPVEGCPTYVEYFKRGDEVPGRLCTLHRGSFKEQARRVLDGILDEVGDRLRDLLDW
jgi:penicillin-binding protein 1A